MSEYPTKPRSHAIATSLALLATAGCAGLESNYRPFDDRPEALADMMADLATVDCPVPTDFLAPRPVVWIECNGTVVAAEPGVVAVKMRKPMNWPHGLHHLVVTIFAPSANGIRGNAVVVGRVGDTLVCRFRETRQRMLRNPAVGDWVSADFMQTRMFESREEFQARWQRPSASES